MAQDNGYQNHSTSWIIQTWLSFVLSVGGVSIGIFFLPVNVWIKAYLGMGLAFSISSTINLAKTQRDLHESQKIITKLEEAKVEKILAEHNNKFN